MAKRKRRRVKKARSSRKATRPWLSLGDTVRVKAEVIDPDGIVNLLADLTESGSFS